MTDRRPQDQPVDESAEGQPTEPPEQPAEAAEQQDFATRNVIMSNALQGGASPAAGGVIGTGGELGMQPSTDEELAEEDEDDGEPDAA
jgi:hypothetical protein